MAKRRLFNTKTAKYDPSPGRDLEGDIVVQVIQAKTDQATASTRDFIAKATTGVIALALVIGTGYGVLHDDYNPVRLVWDFAAPYVGYLFAAYMPSGLHRKDDG